MGVWGKTWSRAAWGAPGGSGLSLSAFPDWFPLLTVYSRSRAELVPDLATMQVVGVRSGTRRRRGASPSGQAGGGTEPETQRAAPARAGAALYGHYAGYARGVYGPEALAGICRATRG